MCIFKHFLIVYISNIKIDIFLICLAIIFLFDVQKSTRDRSVINSIQDIPADLDEDELSDKNLFKS